VWANSQGRVIGKEICPGFDAFKKPVSALNANEKHNYKDTLLT
jgi:hypothetical protein